MIYRTANNSKRQQNSATLLAATLPLVLGACDPAEEELEIVDVDPFEAKSTDAPDIDDALRGNNPSAEYAAIEEVNNDLLGGTGITRYAEARIGQATDGIVSGDVRIKEDRGTIYISGEIAGLPQGKYGFHVHEGGECRASGMSLLDGEHFAPDESPHGSPREPDNRHHAGDLGNIVANEAGVAEITIEDAELSLGTGKYSIIGRTFVVHADPDNLASLPSGNAGEAIACGVVKALPEAAYGH